MVEHVQQGEHNGGGRREEGGRGGGKYARRRGGSLLLIIPISLVFIIGMLNSYLRELRLGTRHSVFYLQATNRSDLLFSHLLEYCTQQSRSWNAFGKPEVICNITVYG